MQAAAPYNARTMISADLPTCMYVGGGGGGGEGGNAFGGGAKGCIANTEK